MRPGLLEALAANEKHEENSIRLFEVGKVYLPREKGDLPQERNMLSGVLCGTRRDRYRGGESEKSETLDFFDAKGILETLLERLGIAARFEPAEDKTFSPGSVATIVVGGESVGVLGEVHPRVAERCDISSRPVFLFEIDLERLLPATIAPRKYRSIPKFPTTLRDIALVVNAEIPSKSVGDIIAGSPLVAKVTLFDVYTGKQVPPGKKSLAFRIAYQSPSRTLTDEEVNRAQQETVKRLARELGAILRQ